MSKFLRKAFSVIDLLVILILTLGSPLSALAAPSATGATIISDQADYPPGALVTLTGAGWAKGEAVHLYINDDGSQSWSLNADVSADTNGAFSYQFNLPNWFVANYSVTASGPTSGTATTTFTDLSIGTYDQCSNDLGTGYSSGDTGCRWINGNLQGNNSTYPEGDATVQRVWLTGFAPGTTHTLTLQYGTTKGGKHAYDFLTTWNWSENWITPADRCQDIAGCETSGENTLDIPQDPNVPDSFEPSAPGDRQFVMRGGTLNSATTPAIVSGSYAGDGETAIVVTFTVASSGDMCPTKGPDAGTCGVAMWFGAHVARSDQWTAFNNTTGAGSVSGSPYHVSLDKVDGASVGSRDNQMQANAVVANGTIVIIKDAIPNHAQDFNFNLTNNGTVNQNFLLDDDSDPTLPNSQTFSVPPGTWSASEFSLPSGWNFTSLVCSDPSNNTTTNGMVATINLASAETVTCTFTNTKEPDKLDLTVSKTATPTFTRTYHWSINKNVDKTQINIAQGGTATFNYTVDVSHDSGTDSNWAVTGTITVNNPNSFSVSGVSVTDSLDPNATCVVSGGSSTIAANSSANFNYTCTYSAAPAASNQTNTATATWTAFGSPNNSASGTANVNWGATSPTSMVDETVSVSDPLDSGSPHTFSNTNPSPSSFSYSRTVSGVAGTCTNYDNTATFTTNDSGTTGSSSKTVRVCVGKDLVVTKTAAGTFDRQYYWQITKDVDKTQVNIAEGGSYTFNYTVNVQQTGVSDSGWVLSGVITITNPNDWEAITLTSLSDSVSNGGTCVVAAGPYSIPASGSLNVNYTCSYASKPSYSGTNTATATWNKATFATPNGSASGNANFNLGQLGTSNKTIHVTDSYAGDLGTVTATDAAPFASASFQYTRTESGVAGTCTSYDNTATITETGQSASKTVTLCVAKDLTVSKTAAGTFDRAYQWSINKNVDKTQVSIANGGSYTFNYTVGVNQTGVSDSGWTLAGKITVSNPNDFEAITVNVNDAVNNGGVCTVVGGTGVSIPASGSVSFDYTCSFASKPASYSGTNTATATWDKAAAFTPNGSASGNANFTLAQLGSTNKTIHVTDSYAGNLGTVTATDVAPFASASFQYSRTESGVAGACTTYDNTATITETSQTASKSVTLCVALDLTVSKTATPSFARAYQWSITKDVDKTHVTQLSGNANFNYTVNVNQTGIADSAWKVVGTITISNPNNWQAITANVSDAVDNGGSCVVASSTVNVPASGSVNVNYTCTFASAPSSASGTNTATAAWNKSTYNTPNGSASGTAGFSFTTPATTNNKTITVTDTFNGTTTTLGTVTATEPPTAPASASFNYSRSVAVPAVACVSYTNTAKIVETGQTASQTVTVCKPSLITNTELCTLINDQFKLVYTPDQNAQSTWKLNASNPGQFYYNIFYTGAGNQDITLTLPYPFITQGAVPIHVYSNVGISTNSLGQTCLTPSGELANQTDQVTMATYDGAGNPPSYNFSKTTTVTVHVPSTGASNFAYINIHLDYGLKGTTGYAKDSNNNAIKSGTSTILIPDLKTYSFSDTAGGGGSVTSTNSFKKNPGIGGLTLTSLGDPKKNTQVKIYSGTGTTGKLLGTVATDDDGWYMWNYKYTGKPATFTVSLPAYSKITTVTLKSNGFMVVNFTIQ